MHYVFGVFPHGGLVAAPLADFVIYQLAPPPARGGPEVLSASTKFAAAE